MKVAETEVESMKPRTLPEQVKELKDKVDEMTGIKKKGRVKKFNIKFKYNVKRQMKRAAKKGKVMLIILGTNRNIDAQIVDMKNGYIMFNGVPRKCTMDYIYLWRGKIPTIVLPDWSLEPIGLEEYYKKCPEGMGSAIAQKFVLGVIESGEVTTKKKMEGKTIVWILLGVLVVLYILFGGSVTGG